jgi:hypothetical protein
MNAAAAQATQRALDAAYLPPLIPVGDAHEDNSPAAWAMWDAAKNTLATADARHAARRFSGNAITGFGELA